jgi:ABC-type lipoprotein release transport system permease subunit
MNLLVMAWRNVWRNSRRSLITIAAMALALWTELIYSGLVSGMVADMAEDVTEYDLGDIQVFSENWTHRPSLHETVDAATLVPKLEEAGVAVAPRLQAGGLAASGELSAGVALVGIDPVRDPKVLAISTAVTDGEWLDPADPGGVVVGRGLARTLALKPGSELVVLSQGADGSMANDLLHVRGVLASVASGTDRGNVMMTEGRFRELMALPAGAHRLVLRAAPGADLKAATAQVESLAPGTDVQSWQELNPLLAQMLGAVKVQVAIVYFILYVAVAILVLNAMLMAIFERIREFGVLKAIGYSPMQVFSLMVLEGLVQAGVATVVGSLLALPVMYWLSTEGLQIAGLAGVRMMGMTMPPVWHGVYTLDVVAVPLVMLFGIVLAAVVYPAAKAAWIRPVEAIHHQ